MMNIFYLNSDMAICAALHCDQHVLKMLVEYVQLMSNTAHYVDIPRDAYRPTHVNHPCSLWARQSRSNFEWLGGLVDRLNTQYRNRFHRAVDHASWRVMLSFYHDVLSVLPNVTADPVPQCMPEEYKIAGRPFEAYQNYYKYDKMKFAKWRKGVPELFRPEYEKIHGPIDQEDT